MQRVEITVEPREVGPKSKLRQLRKSGKIPGVVYGHGEPLTISLPAQTFKKAIHTEAGVNALFTIKVNNSRSLGIIKDIHRDLFTQEADHVDFMRINLREKLELGIPTRLVGEAPGVKKSGGVLEHIAREIRVKCLPDDIPAGVDVDVSSLELGQGIKLSEIKPPDGVEFIASGDTIVVNVVAPKIEEEPAPAAVEEAVEGAAGEPEVISKGKKEEGGGEPAAPAAEKKPVKGKGEKA